MEYKDFLRRKNNLIDNVDNTINNLEQGTREVTRVLNIARNTETIINDLDKRFSQETALTAVDSSFLFLAIGLQMVRQYLLSNEEFRWSDKQGDKAVESVLSLAPPNWKDVLTQSVPYDAICTSSHVSETGLSGATHRYRTLGHDPILGWIFGTANIMTNSLTKTNFKTYQVNNMTIIRSYPLGVTGMLQRAISYAKNDPKLLAVSIARQAIHFGSDYFTKQGLPIPIVAISSDELVKKMISKWHIDMFSVARNILLKTFIDSVISSIHGIFYGGTTDIERKLYEVRTKKIIMYSDLITTSSNIIISASIKDMSKLDICGLGVAIYRLITDAKFIKDVKEEFIFGTYRNMICQGD